MKKWNSFVFAATAVCITFFSLVAGAVPFIPHTGEGEYESYLALNLPLQKYSQIVRIIERREGRTLKTRGEAHITVVTPKEYFHVLKRFVSIEQINKMALAAGIQEIAFEEVCLGRGDAVLEGKNQSTFYVVVNSEGLIRLRQNIAAAIITAGGRAADFDPLAFYPHITLGYTERDLHLEDGVIKDKNSCVNGSLRPKR